MSYQTEQRKILLDFFSKNKDKIFSAEEISNKLKDSNISVSAVYRNLNSLEKIVDKVLKDCNKVIKNSDKN